MSLLTVKILKGNKAPLKGENLYFSPGLSSITKDYFLFQLMLTGGFPRLPAGEIGFLSVDRWKLKLIKQTHCHHCKYELIMTRSSGVFA